MLSFDKWNPLCRSVAAKLAPALTRYGWDADDAAQHASLKLLRVAGSPRLAALTDECLKRYLPVMVRRAVFKACAARKNLLPTAETFILDAAASRGDEWVATELGDLLAGAPPHVRDYLTVTVVEGAEWIGPRTVKTAAARWVRKHLEVSRC